MVVTKKVRQQLIESFKAGEIQYMVATGVAARGIDIENLPVVINYDLPYPADEYVHRIGRTGRADAAGEAVSLVSKDNFKNLCMIESRLGICLSELKLKALYRENRCRFLSSIMYLSISVEKNANSA